MFDDDVMFFLGFLWRKRTQLGFVFVKNVDYLMYCFPFPSTPETGAIRGGRDAGPELNLLGLCLHPLDAIRLGGLCLLLPGALRQILLDHVLVPASSASH